MITIRKTAAAILLFSLPAFALDDAADSRSLTRTIHLKSGTVIEGKLIDLKDNAVVIEFEGVPGSRGSIDRNLIVPSDVFEILMDTSDPHDGDSWLKLATEAGNLGLHNSRIWSLRNAARLSPDRAADIDKEIAQSRQVCSSETLTRAKDYLEAGELERARRYLKDVIDNYVECVSEKEGRELMKRITDDIEKEKARATVVIDERRKTQDKHEELQSVRNFMERGEDALRAGRESLERPGAAINRFEEAQILLERASRTLSRFAASSLTNAGTGKETYAEIKRLSEALRDDRVSVHVELGNAYLSRSDFNNATAHMGEAAALDSENPGVHALRISIAAARANAGKR